MQAGKQVEGKTPTAPETGAGSARGLGVTPRDSATATQLYTYVRPWRFTRQGGITTYIAICRACRKVIPPTHTRRSKAGTHGDEYYAHEHPLAFICLKQSNTGKRKIEAEGDIPAELLHEVRDYWVFIGVAIGEIAEVINEWLEKHEVV